MSSERHASFSQFLAFFIVLPPRHRVVNVCLLAFLRSSRKEDHQSLAILPEVNPVPWPEIDDALLDAGAYAFYV
jgi:hypothetical protein